MVQYHTVHAIGCYCIGVANKYYIAIPLAWYIFFNFKATGCENLIRCYLIIIVPKSIILLRNLTKLTKKQRNLFEARVSSDVKDHCYEENLQYTKYQSAKTF